MLDLKFVRSNPDAVNAGLSKRGAKLSLDKFLLLDEKRRSLLGEVEELKHNRNKVSEEIGRRKKPGTTQKK